MTEEIQISMKAARVNAGISQGEMAKRIGRSQNAVMWWETDKREPRTSDFLRYCEICNIDPKFVRMPQVLENN